MKWVINDEAKSKVIRMAWEDRTSFDEIYKNTGLTETDVIKLMRKYLKPSSFRSWRKRVSGRITKHGKKFSQSRKELKNIPQQKIDIRALEY
ncbi:TIGR03643 family protein [Rubritalea profundi]|uniref:TIGR03643 family protein n=1 Tax=Rubritalea profundi TaxID=1658618 RepID=A0A2S7U145_9BACT|nr:TIGR03643 family protein [Rubritalea profundi]PQJ28719.1 TIGR03643 family protein [Rubritalea profundi]